MYLFGLVGGYLFPSEKASVSGVFDVCNGNLGGNLGQVEMK
jgi:hypothetical protein